MPRRARMADSSPAYFGRTGTVTKLKRRGTDICEEDDRDLMRYDTPNGSEKWLGCKDMPLISKVKTCHKITVSSTLHQWKWFWFLTEVMWCSITNGRRTWAIISASHCCVMLSCNCLKQLVKLLWTLCNGMTHGCSIIQRLSFSTPRMSKLRTSSPFRCSPIPSAFPLDKHKEKISGLKLLRRSARIVGAKKKHSSSGWAVNRRTRGGDTVCSNSASVLNSDGL